MDKRMTTADHIALLKGLPVQTRTWLMLKGFGSLIVVVGAVLVISDIGGRFFPPTNAFDTSLEAILVPNAFVGLLILMGYLLWSKADRLVADAKERNQP